ncbi:CAF1 family ribonuclease [Babesia caballi]|uniref:CAF1 family ribonuclease n=1 Tax=Babesia caballi TaxID=5871 RepID=A0AAV4LVM6_BABCB|nr:CAF1 family ribonuclease [Babesia caballi]
MYSWAKSLVARTEAISPRTVCFYGSSEIVQSAHRCLAKCRFFSSAIHNREKRGPATSERNNTSSSSNHRRSDSKFGRLPSNEYRNRRFVGSQRRFSTGATSRLTWKDHVNEAREALRECDLVAVDVEYTGLHLKDDRFIGLDKCYEAHASGAKQFVPCQIGLTAAKYLGNNEWKITPTAVYTMPSSNKFFKVSTSTLQFLKDNNFDFHSWIHHGVEHLTPSEERERKANIEHRIAELDQLVSNAPAEAPTPGVEFDLSSLTAEDRAVAKDVIGRIQQWMRSGDDAPLELAMESAFQRLLMHTIIGQQFPEVYSHSTRRGDEKVICVYKSQVELHRQQKLALQAELQRIDEEIGVRLLLDEIVRNEKILVGHNCFYDILHVYQTFYGDLPESVEEFRVHWTKKFRNTLDTKYIAEFHETASAPQHSATLKGLFDHMCGSEPTGAGGTRFSVQPLSGTSWRLPSSVVPLLSAEALRKHTSTNSVETGQLHDAGYDSLMTCIVFVLQTARIIRSRHMGWDRLASGTGTVRIESPAFLQAFGAANNCIRLVKSQPNAINLTGSREGDMARYFLMSGYPTSWKKWDIMKVWSPLWVSVSVIDESSCWVIVKNDEDIRNINLIYRMMKNPQFTLQTYDQSRRRDVVDGSNGRKAEFSHNEPLRN